MNGETKLKTWKLFSLHATTWSPCACRLKIRRMKADRRRASVMKATKFQNVNARQVTKSKRLKNYRYPLRQNGKTSLIRYITLYISEKQT